jgi:hypothetical protein
VTSPVFALWQRGLKGPSISLLHNRGEGAPALNETERLRKLGDPIRLKEGEEKLSLDCLARLYPPPDASPEVA